MLSAYNFSSVWELPVRSHHRVECAPRFSLTASPDEILRQQVPRRHGVCMGMVLREEVEGRWSLVTKRREANSFRTPLIHVAWAIFLEGPGAPEPRGSIYTRCSGTNGVFYLTEFCFI